MQTISLKNHQNEHIIQASEHSQITNVSRNTQEDVVRILHSGEQARNTLEIEQYRAMIVAQVEELKAIGLKEIDGKFYVHNMKGMAFWPIVNKKQLMNFPSSAFSPQYHIGNAQGIIQKPKQLAKLFHILDLPIDEVLLAEIQNEK